MDIQELLKSLGLSVARGVPQMASGFVDLAALPFTATGLLKPEQAVGSTDWMTARGYLPPKQPGLLNETTELVSSALNPSAAMKASAAGLLGLTAYHGSPRLFKQFNPAKIGTGEGAQVYGTGAGYVAEAPDVAKSYIASNTNSANANYLYGGMPIDPNDELKRSAAYNLMAQKGDKDAIYSLYSPSFWQTKGGKQFRKEIEKMDYSKLEPAGYLYKGDIPDEIIPSFLDWDKKLSSQQPFEILKDNQYLVDYAKSKGKEVSDLTGRDAYELIASSFDVGQKEAYPMATEYLNNLGVRGIRYLDQGSRGVGEGTSNFVVFRPEDYKVQEINDIPLEEWIRKGLLD